MSFVYPLGLLGLIGVPILIIIYLLKNKYTEQIVASTYLWTLSEKFLKKKKQKKLLSGLISLILQIIAVVTISLLVAHPVITIPNGAKEYCFILDGSGSMNVRYLEELSDLEESNNLDELGTKSKFDIGKEEVKYIIENSNNGSMFTLIYVGENTRVIYENTIDRVKAVELLSKLEPSGVTVDYKTAISYAQEKFNANSSLVTYLVTDKPYKSNNIEVINVTDLEKDNNYTIIDLNFTQTDMLKVSGKVVSYNESTTLEVEIYVDDKLITTENVICSKNEFKEFIFETENSDFKYIKAVIKNEDTLLQDNEKIVYNIEKEHGYTALLVSNNPFYLETVINTFGNITVDVITPGSYSDSITGYSLYVFDSFNPEVLPSDGTIWLFGVETSISGSGFSVQDVVTNEEGLELSYPKNSTTLYKELTKGLLKDKIVVSKLVKYGLYRNFTTLLTYQGNPVIFTGTTDNGNREVVFSFDLHNSNFPLLLDYLILFKNLINYSFPVIMEESNYECGDTVLINVLSSFDSIRVDSPKGNVQYLDVTSEVAEIVAVEPGVYTLSITEGESRKEFSFFVSMPLEESDTDSSNLEELEINLQGEQENNYIDGIYDKLLILFIIISVIFVIDWMVYCYEQYQLR